MTSEHERMGICRDRLNLYLERRTRGSLEELFAYGCCSIFAFALHEKLGYPIRVLLRDGQLVHAYTSLGGKAVDIYGCRAEEELFKRYLFVTPKSVTPVELKEIDAVFRYPDILQGAMDVAVEIISERKDRFICSAAVNTSA